MMDRTRHNNIRHLVCSVLDNKPAAKLPEVMFFVISTFKGETYLVERTTSRMTREKTLHDLRSGELQDVVQIIETEFTPQGLSSRDVTASLLMEADLMRGLAPPSERIAALHDHAQDERKNWRA